jgi:hypothetical protein
MDAGSLGVASASFQHCGSSPADAAMPSMGEQGKDSDRLGIRPGVADWEPGPMTVAAKATTTLGIVKSRFVPRRVHEHGSRNDFRQYKAFLDLSEQWGINSLGSQPPRDQIARSWSLPARTEQHQVRVRERWPELGGVSAGKW